MSNKEPPTLNDRIEAWLRGFGKDRNGLLQAIVRDFQSLEPIEQATSFNLLRDRVIKAEQESEARYLAEMLFALGHKLPWEQHNTFQFFSNLWQRQSSESGLAFTMIGCLKEWRLKP